MINDFLAAVTEAQIKYNKPVKRPHWIHDRFRRFKSRVPPALPSHDSRFAMKRLRKIVCDGCGNIVPYSSMTRRTVFHRIECEFAGSYAEKKWSDIPGELQKRAWEERLIDATWYCSQFCGAEMTGVNTEKRRARADAWQQAGHRSGQRRKREEW